MDPRLLNLFECLSARSSPAAKIERCGFLLGMVLEKNSSQRSPDSLYQEILPEPYLSICLGEDEYRDVVTKASALLSQSIANEEVQQALLFVLGGSNGRTLSIVIPVLVRFVREGVSRNNLEVCVSTLRRMMSSRRYVLSQAAAILSGVGGIAGLDRAIERVSASSKDATLVLTELKRMLEQSAGTQAQ
jgi:hypothetical protein